MSPRKPAVPKAKKTPRRKPDTDMRPRINTDMRQRINVLALIEALEAHVLGEKEMTATQVNAALALLKKTLPDVSEAAKKAMQIHEEDGQAHEDALDALE